MGPDIKANCVITGPDRQHLPAHILATQKNQPTNKQNLSDMVLLSAHSVCFGI